MTTPRIIFCGDRHWSDAQFIYDVMDFIKSTLGNFVVIEGEAQGADSLARACAKELGLEVLKFPADWKQYGKAAGPIRNTRMRIEGKANGVVAFHHNIQESKGTRNMVEQSIKAGLPVWVSTSGFEALEEFVKKLKGE